MENTPQNFDAFLLRKWVIHNVIGFGLASVIAFSAKVSDFNIEMLFLAGIIVGSITGVFQAIVLKKKYPKFHSGWWVFANIIGGSCGVWGAAFVVFNLAEYLPNNTNGALHLTLWGMIIGMCVGLAQVLVLWPISTGIGQWFGATVMGRAIAWGGSSFLMVLLFNGDIDGGNNLTLPILVSLIGGLVGGGIYGLITGYVLGELQPKPQKIKDPLSK